ncbi:YlbL family protein [Goodfellowiella coeruleoviolacea]|uniref:endopeptidase La n=1 Tax=Goodfellowiella coeruleoviolacea TaxID=334858 RepID=A0AAE3KMR0_9PSEU|nr:PDZ domain-containing protein [Goodfellowiella coeruleoviolacea]MCP2167903.1 PDZ domain-containing protein [Goodfellowiella coeruleoviolacea]
MSERSQADSQGNNQQVSVPGPAGASVAPQTAPVRADRGLTRRTWTLVVTFVLVAGLGLLGGFARVPYVALGPGPTYDTLGTVGGGNTPVVGISGQETYPTAGRLTMVTVSLMDDVTLFGALGMWVSGRYALAPREEYFKPGESDQQVQQENVKAFQDSQTNAEAAALNYLGYPQKVLAAEVVKGSAADNVIEPGDQLLAINGKQVASADEVRGILQATKPGDEVQVTFRHDGQDRTQSFRLGTAQDRDWGFLGVSPVNRADVPFQIKIGLADVGGPSAGLMLALAIVDKMTPGELNGGQAVAGTGEITETGEVKPIGGIPFKMMGARDAGATVFLVPADNCVEASQRAPEGLKLVKVTSLKDAVAALDALREGKPTQGC